MFTVKNPTRKDAAVTYSDVEVICAEPGIKLTFYIKSVWQFADKKLQSVRTEREGSIRCRPLLNMYILGISE